VVAVFGVCSKVGGFVLPFADSLQLGQGL
ncbi:hypothetical protein Tco_0998335, partial [Tanacetum coccineum]